METATRADDRFSIAYAVWIALLFLVYAVGREVGLSDFRLQAAALLVMLLSTLVVGLALLASLSLNLPRRRWKRVLSLLAAPFVVFALFWTLGSAGIDARHARFELNKPYYLEQIATLPENTPRFKVFEWGEVGGPAVQNGFFFIVYDESDEIALPAEQRSSDWRARSKPSCHLPCATPKQSSEGPTVIEVTRMAEHFYLVIAWF